MARFSTIHLGLLILALSTCSITGIPVKEQVEQQRQTNIELMAELASRGSRMETLQRNNDILEDLLVKIKVEGVKQSALLNDLFRTGTTSRPRATATTGKNLDEPVEMSVSTTVKRSTTTTRRPPTTARLFDFYP